MNKRWTEEENKYIIENYGKISTNIIVDFLQRSNRKSITKQARKLGVKFPLKERITQRKYNIDFNYFNIPNNNNSYYAGFIAGDGFIDNDLIEITLAIKDIGILESFKKDINTNYPIKFKKRQKKSWSDKVKLSIYSTYITNKLEQIFNIKTKKSFDLSPPNLDNISSLAYIIGLLDADGWITYTKEGYLQVGICGTKEILSWVNNIFINNYNISANINKNGSIFSLNHTGKDAVILGKELSKIYTPYKLPRKWDKPELKDN